MTTTTINISITQLTPVAAVRELMAARKGKIEVAKADRRIDKLLETVPLISLHNGMKARETSTTSDDTSEESMRAFDFDSAYLPGSKVGTRSLTDSADLTFMLGRGIILQARVARDKTSEFLGQENIATLTQDQKGAKGAKGQQEKLVDDYEKALNECDFMLMLLYCAVMRRKSDAQYNEFVTLLRKELKLGKNAMKRMLASIPGTFISTEGNDFLYDTNHGLVGKRARVPWLEDAKDIGSFCVLIPLDYCILDADTSSFQLLLSNAKGYQNPHAFFLYLISYNVSAVIQLYRIGKLVMDAERTEAVIHFLQNAPFESIEKLNYRELVLMGGVLSRERVLELIEKIITAMLQSGEDDQVDHRCGVLFCYLSSLSVAPHCMIDIIERKAEYNVSKYLLSSVKGRRELNVALKESLTDIAFYLMEWLMQVDATRLHYETLETFTDYKYLLHIDTSNPLKSDNLDIFQQRYKLSSRHYIASQKAIGEKDLTIYNEMNSIAVISEDDFTSQTRPYDSTIYIIYNREGTVIHETRGKNTEMEEEDDFTLLENHSLTELLANKGGATSVQQIQDIFSERRIQVLKIPFVPSEGYYGLYIANLDGLALDRFTQRVKNAAPPKEKALAVRDVNEKDDLFQPQIIDLLQEKPIRRLKGYETLSKEEREKGKKQGNPIYDYHHFLSRHQLRILGRAVVSIRELRQEKADLQTQLTNIAEGEAKEDILDEIARIDRENTQWINSILRIPTSSELYGKAAIDRASKEVNQLKGAYNSAAKRAAKVEQQQASKPQGKKNNKGKAKQSLAEEVEEVIGKEEGEESGDDTATDEETRQANKHKKERKNVSKVDKHKAAQMQKEQRNISHKEDVEEQLLKAQEHLADLIHFSTAFEGALAKFIGVTNKGPLTEEYLSNVERVVSEKLGQFHAQRETSVESILKAYGARDIKNLSLTYRFDFSKYSRVVPDKDYIKKYQPSYFTLGATQIASMIINNDEEEQARFQAVHLTNDEVVMMARLEKNEQRQAEFRELIAVLYHMLSSVDSQLQLETHTTIFRRLISEVYQRK